MSSEQKAKVKFDRILKSPGGTSTCTHKFSNIKFKIQDSSNNFHLNTARTSLIVILTNPDIAPSNRDFLATSHFESPPFVRMKLKMNNDLGLTFMYFDK